MGEVRILIVDDHSLFRQSLARFLATAPGCRVVGQCGGTAEAERAFKEIEADVVLMDFDLGEGQGTELIQELHKHQQAARVLMVTAGMPEASVLSAMADGASGVFLKHETLDDLLAAVHCVAAGEIWLDPGKLQDPVAASRTRNPIPARPLTPRQGEVMRGILDGLSNKEIAAAVNASESAVKAVIQELFRKAGVRTRSQLVRIAIEKHSSDWLRAEPYDAMPRS